MQNKFALALCLAAALASVAGCSKSGSNSNTAGNVNNVTLSADQLKNVRLVTIEPSGFHKMIDTNGVVDFDNDQATSVLAPFSGPVEKLLVVQGQRVTKGQPLAIISSPDFAADVGAYRKALVAARTARRVADFDKDLLSHQGVSQREEEQAQTDATSAEADAASARQALVGIDVDPRTIKNIEQGKSIARIEGPIRSPISGIVVEKLITPGELLQAGTTATFTVADLSRVWVMAQLFGSDPASISVGDAAKVDTGAGNPPISGRVENIASEVDPNTLAVAVRVAVDNPGDRLKKQMYVRVAIEDHRQSTGLLVPVSSVLQDDENLPFVYVAQADGSFARAHVTLGYRAGDRYAIADGLRAGQRVVADGALFLQFMQDQ
jgi:cobalt-zinc-cadmium efflux system membrane fusion protein